MRYLKIALTIITVFIVAIVIALFIFLNTFDINQYKPQIIQHLSETLGAEVSLETLDFHLSFRQGIILKLKGFRIFNKSIPSLSYEFYVDQLSLTVNARTLIQEKQIVVSGIHVKSPVLKIIRLTPESPQNYPKNEDGSRVINQSQGQGEKSPQISPKDSQQDILRTPTSDTSLPLLVKIIKVENGVMTYVDRTFHEEVVIELTQVDLKIDKFSLTEPFRFDLRSVLWSTQQNFQVKGKAQINLSKQQMRFDNTHMFVNLSKISLDSLNHFLAFRKDVIFEEIAGTFSAKIDPMIAGSLGLLVLSSDGQLKEGSVKLRNMGSTLSPLEAKFEITESNLRIKEVTISSHQGKIKGSANIYDYLESQNFDFDIQLNTFELADLIKQDAQGVELKGQLNGNFKGNGKGFNAEALNTLRAEGILEIKKGRIANINMLKTVLGKISMIPGIIDIMEENLPEEYKEKLKNRHTTIDEIAMKTMIENSKMFIKEFKLQAEGFALNGHGEMSFDQVLSLRVAMLLPQDLSLGMVSGVEELQSLLNENKQIYIPLDISGKIPNLTYLPDLKFIGKKILMKRGTQELNKVFEQHPEVQGMIDTVLDIIGEQTSNESPKGEDPPSNDQDNKQDSRKELIGDILNSIFK